ncbi:MAG: helix-turn-helix transcriptional regulator [Chloroflexi bacterium]|nr:helix-turn-helix transcriptional regulator [Chloroflexota bacterium]
MKSIERLQSRFDEWWNDPEYLYEGLVLDFTEQVVAAMIRSNVRRSELAERLGTSRGYVTKLLDGQENMTLKTIVRVANALDMKVDVKLARATTAPRKRRTVKSAVGPSMRGVAASKKTAKRPAAVAARAG